MITMSSAMSMYSDPAELSRSWWWTRRGAGFFRRLIIAAVASLAGAALVGLTGCSALRIGYGQAPDLIYWWLDGYVDFDGDQTSKVRDALAQWFAWHRRTQLPEYADQLVRAQREVLADTTPARVCDWQRELIKRAHTAYDRAEPAAAEIVLTITTAQIAHLEKRYTKNNDEFRDEYLQAEPAQRAKKNLDRVLDRAEMLYGRLDDAQRNRIAEQLARSPFDPEVWLAERQQRQQDALRLLRSMGADGTMSREQAASALRGYVDRLEHSPRDAYRRYAERLGEFNCTLAANLHNGTTASQRRAAAKKLASWEGDLRAIAALGNR
jgi:hypothetical protein